MPSRVWALLAVVFAAEWRESAILSAAENYAFLVAVGDYDRKELKPLHYTRNDMIEFQKELINAGYSKDHIVLMHDDLPQLKSRRFLPESAKIREELQLLLSTLDPDDSLIVALSGHGARFKGEDKDFFCPADARLNERSTMIAITELYDSLKKCKARQKLLLVDACRDNPQSELSKARQTVELESVTRPQREAVPEGLITVFSCAAGQRSFEDPELKHGVFFYHVLQGIKGSADNGDRKVTLDELIAFTTTKTESFARSNLAVIQTPARNGNFTGTWVLRTLKGTSLKPLDPLVPFASQVRGGEYDRAFDSDGRVTSNFGTGGSEDSYAVAVQKDGKVVTAGQVERGPGKNGFFMAVARHNPDGTLDPSFAGDGTLSFSFSRFDDGMTGRLLAIQPDGKIVVAGRTDLTGYHYDYGVARLNADGSFDKSFGTSGASITSIADQAAYPGALALQRDGKIIVAGNAKTSASNPFGFAMIRLLSNGKLDGTFSGDGKATADVPGDHEEVNHVAVQPDGRIALIGVADGPGERDAIVVRFNPDGSLDRSFDSDGILAIDFGKTFDNGNYVVAQGSRLVVAVNTTINKQSKSVLLRLNADGSIDKTFGGSGTGTAVSRLQVNGPMLLPDGRIAIVDANYSGLEIYSKDGALDPNVGSQPASLQRVAGLDVLRHATLAPDNRIVLTGNAPAGGKTDWLVVRLLAP